MVSPNVPHGPEFFQQMSTCQAAYERLGLVMAEVLTLDAPAAAFVRGLARGRTLLDIGCGLGYQTAVLARYGFACDAVDPFSPGCPPGVAFTQGDPIECPSLCPGPYDVVICTETAEHVYPERANELVLAVAARMKRGGLLIWSAARPGQEWEGHVNLQPPEYWFMRFAALGVHVDRALTNGFQAGMMAAHAQHCGAVDNFVVLQKDA